MSCVTLKRSTVVSRYLEEVRQSVVRRPSTPFQEQCSPVISLLLRSSCDVIISCMFLDPPFKSHLNHLNRTSWDKGGREDSGGLPERQRRRRGLIQRIRSNRSVRAASCLGPGADDSSADQRSLSATALTAARADQATARNHCGQLARTLQDARRDALQRSIARLRPPKRTPSSATGLSGSGRTPPSPIAKRSSRAATLPSVAVATFVRWQR